jgi:hypothetical protein
VSKPGSVPGCRASPSRRSSTLTPSPAFSAPSVDAPARRRPEPEGPSRPPGATAPRPRPVAAAPTRPPPSVAGRRPSSARIQYADRDDGNAGCAPDLTPRTAANPPDRETSLLQGAKTGARAAEGGGVCFSYRARARSPNGRGALVGVGGRSGMRRVRACW